MNHIKRFFWLLSISLMIAPSVMADVLFTHEIQSYDYLMGNTDTRMIIGYTDGIKYTDQEVQYKASFLKRFFGKVKTGRNTSEFNLKNNTMSEIDWANRYVYTYSLDRVSDPDWHKKRAPLAKEREAFTKERYLVSPPDISFEFSDEKEIIQGYSTRRVDIRLNLRTLDKKKNTHSDTNITQSLWLTDHVKGFDQYSAFNKNLSLKTQLDPHRLGLLGDLLENYPYDLNDIADELSKIRGYAVKSHLYIEGSYIQNNSKPIPKKSTLILKEETMLLKDIMVTSALDTSLFTPPEAFAQKIVK